MYFRFVLVATIVSTFLELASWIFEGVDTSLGFLLNQSLNSLLIATSALPLTAWFIYFDYRIYDSESVRFKRKQFYYVPNILIFILVVINFFTPVLFSLETGNVYTRGSLSILVGSIQLIYLLIYVVDKFFNKTLMEDNVRTILVLLTIFPVLGWLLQSLFLGSAFLWPMMTFLVFNSFIVIERDEMFRDVLTNLYSRSQLEKRIIINLRKKKNFSIVMIDLDDLKCINDKYGHEQGDYALKTLAMMLSTSIRKTDYAYRYAGDEFMLIIENDDQKIPIDIVTRVLRRLDFYNETETKPYKIRMSYGHYFVDAGKETSITNILASVDKKMYEDKKLNKKTPNNRSYANQV
jgi:diguanylate cyclase (GGDEF)-like protein